MSRSYVETFFRHKTLCVAPVLVAAALGGALALNRPAQYVASASIFADAPLPAPSTVGTTGGNAPPAAGQQALMNNFLATRSFLLSVGKSAQLPGFGADEPAPVLAKSLAALRRDVATAIPGPNVMVVTVTRPDAAGATRVAGAVVDQFLSLERNTIGHRAQSQLADAKAQLQPAAKAVTDAQTALTTYLRAHPGSSAAGDPQLALLRTALTHADAAS